MKRPCSISHLIITMSLLSGSAGGLRGQSYNDAVNAYNRGNDLNIEEKHVEAIVEYEKAARWFSAIRPDSVELASCLHNLGLQYQAMGEYGKAEPLYVRSLEIHESKAGKNHAHTATILNSLANLNSLLGRPTKAESLYRRSLEIREITLGKDHPDTASSLHNLAQVYASVADFGKAEPLYRRALEIFEAKLGRDHALVGQVLNSWANLYLNMGLYDKADVLSRRSLEIFEARLGKEHRQTALSLLNQGNRLMVWPTAKVLLH